MRIIGNNPAADNAEITAIASGTLPDGKPVIVNANGTVSVVVETTTSVPESLGGQTNFNGQSVDWIDSTYDENANRVVIVYSDAGNSLSGTAIVGTVSGSTISFGSEVVFNSGSTKYCSICYDQNAQKVVVVYQGAQSYGRVRVGTVSGTSISFGTEAVFASESTNDTRVTYHEAAQKVVIAFLPVAWNYGRMTVGTVSGTTISFGSFPFFYTTGTAVNTKGAYDPVTEQVILFFIGNPQSRPTAVAVAVSGTTASAGTSVIVDSTSSSLYPIDVTYDRAASKVVVVYYNGRAAVGTVSGTNITFGSYVSYDGTTQVSNNSIVYSSLAEKVIVAYYWTNGSQFRGYVRSGTISGTSISFSARSLFVNAGPVLLGPCVDTDSGYVLIPYRSNTQSNFGYANLYRPPYTQLVTNLTTENFIGFTDGATADTGRARVQIGCSINGAQSSLTAGQQYFVQTDGTLGLTADDPSVIAGTAVSATEIIVKG